MTGPTPHNQGPAAGDPFAEHVAGHPAADDVTEAASGAAAAAAGQPSDDLATAREERDRYLDSLQRLKAEFDNYRKRVERDRQAQQGAAVREFVADLLPVIDNLERAVASAEGAESQQILTGVEMVRSQMAGLLAGKGVQEIDAHGTMFDPEVHDAVARQASVEHEEGTVVHVLERGYRIGDSVVRPAKVVVASPPPGGAHS